MSEKQKHLKTIQNAINVVRVINKHRPTKERAHYVLLAQRIQDLIRDSEKLPERTLDSFYDYTAMIIREGKHAI